MHEDDEALRPLPALDDGDDGDEDGGRPELAGLADEIPDGPESVGLDASTFEHEPIDAGLIDEFCDPSDIGDVPTDLDEPGVGLDVGAAGVDVEDGASWVDAGGREQTWDDASTLEDAPVPLVDDGGLVGLEEVEHDGADDSVDFPPLDPVLDGTGADGDGAMGA